MKNQKLTFALLGLIALLFVPGLMRADEIERTLAQKKFDVSSNAMLEIDHKFGEVICKNWDEKAISVKVTATLKARSMDKAEKLLDRIEVKLKGNSEGVKVECDFDDRIFDGNKDQISIQIMVMMPEDIRLDLEHQFGNAYIDVVSGSTNISSEYGTLEIKALKNESNKIEIDFGEARINYLHQGDVDISYSTFTVDESQSLNIETSYSNVKINKAENIEIENEGGNVSIGRVETINLSSAFSDFSINRLGDFMKAKTEYGSLRLDAISVDFSGVEVENSFGGVSLNFDPNASFALQARLEFCSLDYPQNRFEFSKRILEATEKYYEGSVGEKADKALVKVESDFGNVIINM